MNKYQIQNTVNDTYMRCEHLKNEIALLNAMYNSTVATLNTLVFETGIHPNVEVNN